MSFVQCYSYRGGRKQASERECTRLGELWWPPSLTYYYYFVSSQGQSVDTELNSTQFGIVHAGSRGWLALLVPA